MIKPNHNSEYLTRKEFYEFIAKNFPGLKKNKVISINQSPVSNEIYEKNKSWADQFSPRIIEILGAHHIKVAPIKIDQMTATDFMLEATNGINYACRIRERKYNVNPYYFQFTIRTKVKSGVETELSKIRRGHANYMFYGFQADHSDNDIGLWYIIDLNIFRFYELRRAMLSIAPRSKENKDGTAFEIFDIRAFPKDAPLIINSSHPELFRAQR